MIRVVSRLVVRTVPWCRVLPGLGEEAVVGTLPQCPAGRPAQEQQGDQEVHHRPEPEEGHGVTWRSEELGIHHLRNVGIVAKVPVGAGDLPMRVTS